MRSKWLVPAVLTTLLSLVAGPAMAVQITFQASEVDLGQDTAVTTPIDGDEWLTFGIDMNGAGLSIYGPPNPDPFPPATDKNGVFNPGGNTIEIIFIEPLSSLEVDWFSPNGDNSTLVAYNPSGAAIRIVTNNTGATQKTELFNGEIKRVVIQSAPEALCVANLRFQLIAGVPAATTPVVVGLALLLLLALTFVSLRPGRAARQV